MSQKEVLKNGHRPFLIPMERFQDSKGALGILDHSKIPFKVLRTFWITQVPENTSRGGHAHRTSKQLLISVGGIIDVEIEDLSSQKHQYQLSPSLNQALYLPPLCWGFFTFSKQAVALCMASDYFNEHDYIRDYREFVKLKYDRQG